MSESWTLENESLKASSTALTGGCLYFDMASFLADGMPEPPAPTVLARSDGVSLFYSANVNTIYGDPESGKTWVALAAVAETVMAGGKAVVIDLDHNGPQTTVTRLQMLGLTVDQLSNPELFAYVDPEDPTHLNKVVADLKTRPADVVVFDSLGEIIPFYGLNSNSPDDFTKVFRTVINPPALAGACVIVIDHLAKGTESRAKGATGTYAKKRVIGGVSLKATVQTGYAPGHGGKTLLTVEKDRNGGLKQYCLTGGKIGPVAAVFELIPTGGWNVAPPKDGQRNPDDEAKPELVDRLLKANPFPANVTKAREILECNRADAGKAFKEAKRIQEAESSHQSRITVSQDRKQRSKAEIDKHNAGSSDDGTATSPLDPASTAVLSTTPVPSTALKDTTVPSTDGRGAVPSIGYHIPGISAEQGTVTSNEEVLHPIFVDTEARPRPTTNQSAELEEMAQEIRRKRQHNLAQQAATGT